MGRKLRSSLPQITTSLVAQWSYIYSYLKVFREANQKFKEPQKKHYDCCHCVCNLPEIPANTDVWMTTSDLNIPEMTVQLPRSYLIQTPTGELQRNRSQINVNPVPETQQTQPTNIIPCSLIVTRSCTGTTIISPKRLT